MLTKRKIKPEVECVSQFSTDSIRYLQHGYPSELVRWHCHEEYELHYIVETRGKAFIGDYIGNFSPHSLFLVGPNLPHNWISEIDSDKHVPVRDLVVNFSHDFVLNCESNFPEMQSLRGLWENAKYGIEFLDPVVIDAAHQYFREVGKYSGFKRLTRFWSLMELLSTCSQTRMLSRASRHSSIDKKVLKQISLAITYITDNLDANITQEEVAKLVNMGTTYFSKVFKKTTGHGFVRFVNGCRIDMACELLTHSEEPITEICFKVGFNNISNFNRQFFSLKGMTPSDYRKSALEGIYQTVN
ncbi:AraC family transcriptional regulator [Alteromonas sp. a30]|uniref:AraC family transcriptional regulator n=1 Tax=Alteromonas sp. a30 TaxID=2730917 RepID=UPI002282CC1D|nr:AraC family transcriptional regulator [Alteromonas sp. a30]MCY7296723.1 AraC family transcriptional regulator [Alteromonas sp. a30]